MRCDKMCGGVGSILTYVNFGLHKVSGAEPLNKFAVVCNAVPWLRRLVACLSPRRPGFEPGSVHVGLVVDKVALGQAFPRVLRFSPVNFIPPVLHNTEEKK
jgi:hypothetical protein